MPRAKFLDDNQREIAVHLLRGLVLEHGGLEEPTAKDMVISQPTISQYTYRNLHPGELVVRAICKAIKRDFSEVFEDPVSPSVYGDIPGWAEAEEKLIRKLKTRKKDEVRYSDHLYAAVRTMPIRDPALQHRKVNVTPEIVETVAKRVHRLLGEKGYEKIGKYIEDDERRTLMFSSSRVKISPPSSTK